MPIGETVNHAKRPTAHAVSSRFARVGARGAPSVGHDTKDRQAVQILTVHGRRDRHRIGRPL